MIEGQYNFEQTVIESQTNHVTPWVTIDLSSISVFLGSILIRCNVVVFFPEELRTSFSSSEQNSQKVALELQDLKKKLRDQKKQTDTAESAAKRYQVRVKFEYPLGSPLHRENKENGKKNHLCQGKHREFGNFAKMQGKHREFCFLQL